MSNDITVTIKPAAGGDRFSIVVKSSFSMAEVKDEVAKQASIDPAEQRLIFKGQILKDDRTVESYGRDGDRCSFIHWMRTLDAMHLVGSISNNATSVADWESEMSRLGSETTFGTSSSQLGRNIGRLGSLQLVGGSTFDLVGSWLHD